MMQALISRECLVLCVLFIGGTGLHNKLQVHLSEQQTGDHFSTEGRGHKLQAESFPAMILDVELL